MNIIDKGIPKNKQIHIAQCASCHSVISFKREEARYQSNDNYPTFLVIECPVCHDDVYKEIPKD